MIDSRLPSRILFDLTCILSLISCVQLSVTLWAPLSMGFSRPEPLEWIAMPFSRGTPQSRDRTCISCFSCIDRWVLSHQCHLGSPYLPVRVTQSCLTLCNPMDCSPWNSPGQNTGVGSLSLLQGIFPTQGWNPGHLHCRRILYQLSHQGSPRDGRGCPDSRS